MIALTSPYLWYTTRATGLMALVLFTGVVSLGALVALRVGGSSVGRFEISELHRSLSIVAMVFLGIHILTTVLDSFVSTGLLAAVIPLTSSYRRVPVALGAVALDLMLAVWLSSLVKTHVANATWRLIHWFSWLAWATALVHAVTTGTDARGGVGLVLVGLCGAIGAGAGLWRALGRPTRAAGRTALSPLAPAPPANRRHAGPAREMPARPRVETPTRAERSGPPPTEAPAAIPRRAQDETRRRRR